jgi:hypothetical protein
LLNMPSPPLDKLYGSVLESFGYPRSPMLSAIREGVKVRNDLIHKPDTGRESEIDIARAVEYVEDIQGAINHLLHLLHPDYPGIWHLFQKPF